MKGFLGTWAGFGADLNLVIQIAMGVALILGTCLARSRRYRAHGVCMTAVLILNLAPIALLMWPSFHAQVVARLPRRWNKAHVAVAAAHGILGAAAELFGLYIVLVAATDLLPKALRFARWKRWMRFELALWWLALGLGIATYFVWYVPSKGR